MITAVFFDFFGTLARMVPEQETLLSQAAAVHGLLLPPVIALQGLATAGAWWQQQMAKRPLERRTEPERYALYQQFDERVLAAAGFEVDPAHIRAIFTTMLELGQASHLEVYDDVFPALDDLQERGFTLGVISNMDASLRATLESLDLSGYFPVAVSSQEAGCAKPDPAIFRWAAQQADLDPTCMAYVGDTPEIDLPGARSAGLLPLLVDRMDAHQTVTDTRRIASLAELSACLAASGAEGRPR